MIKRIEYSSVESQRLAVDESKLRVAQRQHLVHERRMYHYNRKLSDREIASAMGSSLSAVRCWRVKHALPAHPKTEA